MRKTGRRGLKRTTRRRQRDVLCDVMLSARQCETWLTLDELARLTHYPPASISAQLRHLRKPEYGGVLGGKQPPGRGGGPRGGGVGTMWGAPIQRPSRLELAVAPLRGRD